MRRVLAAAVFLSLLTTASYAQFRETTVSGCAIRGAQSYCVTLITPGLRQRYDITNVQPKPRLNTYGTVTGTLHEHWFGPCGGQPAISPGTWKYRGQLCRAAKKRHKG